MSRRPMTVEDLWALPRVGTPKPAPDGAVAVVPVTTYDMTANEGTTRLWLVPTAGGTPRALTSADRSASQPAWSPDGARLAFVRKPGGAPGKGDAGPRFPDQPQLYLLDLAGGEPERLTDLPLGVADPTFFPDGRRVAFLAQLLADDVTVDGTAELAKARDEDPVKAYTSESRVYRYWDHWLTDGKVHHLFVLDLESRALLDLTPDLVRWLGLFDATGVYDIRPDGQEIAFQAVRSDPPHSPLLMGLFTVPVPGWGRRGRGTGAAAVEPGAGRIRSYRGLGDRGWIEGWRRVGEGRRRRGGAGSGPARRPLRSAPLHARRAFHPVWPPARDRLLRQPGAPGGLRSGRRQPHGAGVGLGLLRPGLDVRRRPGARCIWRPKWRPARRCSAWTWLRRWPIPAWCRKSWCGGAGSASPRWPVTASWPAGRTSASRRRSGPAAWTAPAGCWPATSRGRSWPISR